jgi:hypothetical protein
LLLLRRYTPRNDIKGRNDRNDGGGTVLIKRSYFVLDSLGVKKLKFANEKFRKTADQKGKDDEFN